MERRKRARALYLPHGGGPLPLLGDEGHSELVIFLSGLGSVLGRPAAILVASAHWEEHEVRVTSSEAPGLLYDYYGFPKAAYEIEYPVPGDPVLAGRVIEALRRRGNPCAAGSRIEAWTTASSCPSP